MWATGPFNLIDRLDPEKDVDGDELGRTVNAIDDLNDKPHGERRAGTFDRNEAFGKIEDYQRSRNLKVDGKMNPKGPTAKRIAAEKHLHSRAEPRRVAIPISGGVGPGQPNRAADVRAVANGLTLAGHRAVLPKPVNPDAPDHAGEAAIRKHTIAAQRAHGETPDGIVKRGGPTQSLLGYLAAPHVAHLAGSDPDNPKPFQPSEPAIVGRTKRDRPTTIITFDQDERTLPDKAEHEAAVNLSSLPQKLLGIGTAHARGRGVSPGKDHRSLHYSQRFLRSQGEITQDLFDVVPKPDAPEGRRTVEEINEGRRQNQIDIIRRAISDYDAIPGRPRINEGDMYTGQDTYGDADGR